MNKYKKPIEMHANSPWEFELDCREIFKDNLEISLHTIKKFPLNSIYEDSPVLDFHIVSLSSGVITVQKQSYE